MFGWLNIQRGWNVVWFWIFLDDTYNYVYKLYMILNDIYIYILPLAARPFTIKGFADKPRVSPKSQQNLGFLVKTSGFL